MGQTMMGTGHGWGCLALPPHQVTLARQPSSQPTTLPPTSFLLSHRSAVTPRPQDGGREDVGQGFKTAFKTGWQGTPPPPRGSPWWGAAQSLLPGELCRGLPKTWKEEESKPAERSPPCFLAQRRQNKSSTGHYLVST